jgi:hypothetical protein
MVKLGKEEFNELVKTHGRKAAFAVSSTLAMVAPVAAADNETSSFDLSSLSPMIQGAADLMPDMLTLLLGAGALVIGGAVIGFVTGTFDKILDGITIRGRR